MKYCNGANVILAYADNTIVCLYLNVFGYYKSASTYKHNSIIFTNLAAIVHILVSLFLYSD